MRIEKIIYNNFRNYKGNQIFELNNHITILYGDNGNGKSSFFDGIEWCLTGNISRFTDKKVSKEALANKQSKCGEECSVEIYFPTFSIKRSFNLINTGFGNIDFSLFIKNKFEIYEKKASGEANVDVALRKMFEEHGMKYIDEKYKIGEIINKSYVLSQDQISDFVTRDKPSDRYNALASIMGFERVLKIRKNLSTSSRYFDDAKENLIIDLEKLNESKNNLQNDLKEINQEIFHKCKEHYNFEPHTSSDVEQESKKIRNFLFDIEQEYKEIERVNFVNADTVIEIEALIKQKKEEIFLVEKNLKEQVIEENKLELEIKEIEQSLVSLSENDKKFKEFEKTTKQIKHLSNELIKLEIKSEDSKAIKNTINNLHEINRKIEFQKKNKKEYDSSKKIVNEFDEKFDFIKNQLENEKQILKKIIDQKTLIEKELLKVDEESSLNSLIKSIEDIYDYVEENEIKNICPVCSSNVNNNLKFKISSNLNEIVNKTKEKKDIVVENLKKKEKIEIKENSQRNLIQSLEFDIKKLETEYKISKQTILFVEENELFSEKIMLDNNEIVKVEKSNLLILERYQQALEINEKIINQKEKLNTIYINKNLMNIDFQSLQSKSIKLKDQLKKKKFSILDKEKEISNMTNQLYKINEVKNQFVKYFSKYDEKSINKVKITLKSKLQVLEENLLMINSLLPFIENKNFNQGINSEILRIKEKIVITNKTLDRATKKSEIIQSMLLKIDNEYGKEAANFLNTSRSTIQTYYRYLNPSPGQFNNLFFEVINNEELHIKIKESIKNHEEEYQYFADANMVLSSGQLNVLALSIFIATNEAQNPSFFDLIAIDDPIQNMDDINRFSICDVLSQLNRQLIFSTHDQEFLNLFLKKNETQVDNMTIYVLNASENKYISLDLKND